ncbi:MAG TPA: hypothetical protein VLX92_31380 [Kofleriaceae bacterium]|nr:hypothetical protein [Kofleriaceae bacterium]
MNYSIEQAALLARQLEGFATREAHQLAGHAANLEFWLSETCHVLATIDDYPDRFRRLRDAQQAWVKLHETRTNRPCPICQGKPCELGPHAPPPPKRIPSEEMDAARVGVRGGCYRFLLRLYRIKLLDESALRSACDRVGVTLEREDIDE